MKYFKKYQTPLINVCAIVFILNKTKFSMSFKKWCFYLVDTPMLRPGFIIYGVE